MPIKKLLLLIVFASIGGSLVLITRADTNNPATAVYTNNIIGSTNTRECNDDPSAGGNNYTIFNANCDGSAITTNSPVPAPVPTSTLHTLNYDELETGTYTQQEVKNGWQGFNVNVYTFKDPQDAVIIDDEMAYSGKSLRLRYKKDAFVYQPANYRVALNERYDELYVAYRVRVADNFNGQRGGKLPGLCGGACNTGNKKPDGFDGWSARNMWRDSQARLVQYIYHPNQAKTHADDYKYAGDPVLTDGEWHHIEHRIVMNTPGQKNGIAEAWLDGKKVLSTTNLEYRKTNSFAIDGFYFSTFFGGGDQSWAPTSDQFAYFDDIVISESPISH